MEPKDHAVKFGWFSAQIIWSTRSANNSVKESSCSTRSRQTREQVDHQWIISWSYCQNIQRIKQPSLSLFVDGWIDKQCEVDKSDLDQMKTMLTKIYAEWAHKKEIGEQDLAFVNEQKTPTRQKRFQPDKTLADVGVSLYHCSASYNLLIKPIHWWDNILVKSGISKVDCDETV